MALFQYTVLQHGSRRTGILDAASIQSASERLRAEGSVILELKAAATQARAAGAGQAAGKIRLASASTTLSHLLIRKGQVEVTVRQLASVLTAGIPILTALQAVGRQAPHFLKRVYEKIEEKVRRGHSLSRSLREDAPFLGRVPIGLIAVGEANGTLDEMLAYSADLMAQARKVRAQIVQAFTYPVIVILGAFGVGYYMVAHVFPKIMGFIQKQGKNVTLPLPTRILVRVSDFLGAYGVYVLVAPLILIVLFLLARRSKSLGTHVDHALLRLPVLGKAFQDHANTMWCRTLGALLRSGITILSALELVAGTMSNKYYAVQFETIRSIVQQGGSLTKGLESTALRSLCPMSLTMVSVSEEAGGLAESLLHVSDYSEERLTRRVAMLSKLVEPAIFIVIGGMVGFIYFAFFLAMLTATRSAR